MQLHYGWPRLETCAATTHVIPNARIAVCHHNEWVISVQYISAMANAGDTRRTFQRVPCKAAHPLRPSGCWLRLTILAYPGWPVGVPLHFSEDQVPGLKVVWHCPATQCSLGFKKRSDAYPLPASLRLAFPPQLDTKPGNDAVS